MDFLKGHLVTQKLKTSVCSVKLSWRDKAAFTSMV